MLVRWSLTLVCCLYCCPEHLVKFKSYRGPLMNQALLRFKRNLKKLLKLSGCVLETFVVALKSLGQKASLRSWHGWPHPRVASAAG